MAKIRGIKLSPDTKSYRKARNITRAKMVSLLAVMGREITESLYYKWEVGLVPISIVDLSYISEILQVDPKLLSKGEANNAR